MWRVEKLGSDLSVFEHLDGWERAHKGYTSKAQKEERKGGSPPLAPCLRAGRCCTHCVQGK